MCFCTLLCAWCSQRLEDGVSALNFWGSLQLPQDPFYKALRSVWKKLLYTQKYADSYLQVSTPSNLHFKNGFTCLSDSAWQRRCAVSCPHTGQWAHWSPILTGVIPIFKLEACYLLRSPKHLKPTSCLQWEGTRQKSLPLQGTVLRKNTSHYTPSMALL